MSQKNKSAISPTRNEDYSQWYLEVIKAADLAEHSCVRGCMVIKPWGYGIWENIQRILDGFIKATGHKNAYFPLFIPLSFLEKEAQHVEGFAKECAVVTHHRLEKGKDGKLIPAGELDEPLVIRPTSEMIIGDAFSRWVQSYRDLPLLINQWANIVRWEMRTRMFLRTTEFLWQEGHTVHANQAEAIEETMKMLNVYVDFCENYLAVPVIKGEKTEAERFPGAVQTFCIEAMMQDRKALQAGTSHFLGQNFSKSCGIKFWDEEGKEQYGWTTSWGVATRLIGALIMVHSDDDGFVLPPKVAPSHIVILPVIHKAETKEAVLEYCNLLAKELEKISYQDRRLSVVVDDSDERGGEKKWKWIKKGVPLRIEIGPRDIEQDLLCITRRDKAHNEVIKESKKEFLQNVVNLLDEIHHCLLNKALDFRAKNTVRIDSKEEFYKFFTPENSEKPEIHGGFALCHFAQDVKIEQMIKQDLNVTIRCIPLDDENEAGVCIFTGNPSSKRVIFAKAY